jgi:hypothetical protein
MAPKAAMTAEATISLARQSTIKRIRLPSVAPTTPGLCLPGAGPTVHAPAIVA